MIKQLSFTEGSESNVDNLDHDPIANIKELNAIVEKEKK